MFSGKTSALLRALEPIPTDQVALFKHDRDDRYMKSAVVTHNGVQWPARVVHSADDIPANLHANERLVGIDEGHFFGAGLPTVCEQLRSQGADVLVTALDMDSWGQPFPSIESLSKTADRTERLTSICARCGIRATHTQRTTPIIKGRIIGGTESFEPRCRRCWTPPPEPPVDPF
jgi:thymidine kinase